MTEAIVVAIITGGLTLLGTIYSSNKTAQTMNAKLDRQQAVTETKLEDLTHEVRESMPSSLHFTSALRARRRRSFWMITREASKP